MQPNAVESTFLATVAYDAARQVLQLAFRDGTLYCYLRVPAAVYQSLLLAPSKGAYFNREIRNRYPSTKLASLS
jgi:KTSC domain